jgi:hypothetical protein
MVTERPADHDLPMSCRLAPEAKLMSAFGTKQIALFALPRFGQIHLHKPE